MGRAHREAHQQAPVLDGERQVLGHRGSPSRAPARRPARPPSPPAVRRPRGGAGRRTPPRRPRAALPSARRSARRRRGTGPGGARVRPAAHGTGGLGRPVRRAADPRADRAGTGAVAQPETRERRGPRDADSVRASCAGTRRRSRRTPGTRTGGARRAGDGRPSARRRRRPAPCPSAPRRPIRARPDATLAGAGVHDECEDPDDRVAVLESGQRWAATKPRSAPSCSATMTAPSGGPNRARRAPISDGPAG